MSVLHELWDTATRTRQPTAIAVLADALSERGDPRGRFMQLLLTGGRPAYQQAADLLEQHREHWLGDFADVALHGTDVWRHGLLVGFRGRRDAAAWPAPDKPAWRTIEQLDLRGTPLSRALSVIDAPVVPLRALHNVGIWGDVQTLLTRPSPRKTLELLGTDEYPGPATDAPFAGQQLRIGTLRSPVALDGDLAVAIHREQAPLEVQFHARQARHRRLPRMVDQALQLHRSRDVTTSVRHLRDGEVVFALDLGTTRTACLVVEDGLPVGWSLLRGLSGEGVEIRITGEPVPTLLDRLDRRCPGWRRVQVPREPVGPRLEFRATLSSWQVTRPLSSPRFNEYDVAGRRWVQLVDDLDGLVDSRASGRTHPHERAEWPPR